MKELVSSGLSFIALAVVLAIGVGIVVMTNDIVVDIVGNGTILDGIIVNVGTALTTFTALLPILALAIVGGLALAYVLGFFRGSE